MWRPKNWNEVYKKYPAITAHPEFFEAGADAMLEALRGNGEHIEESKYYCSPCGACFSDEDCRAYESGWLVFIPEEEKK